MKKKQYNVKIKGSLKSLVQPRQLEFTVFNSLMDVWKKLFLRLDISFQSPIPSSRWQE